MHIIQDGHEYRVGGDASPWISVADRLPPDFARVLTWGPYHYQVDSAIDGQLGYGATHWMPIPPMPTEAA